MVVPVKSETPAKREAATKPTSERLFSPLKFSDVADEFGDDE